MATLNSNLILAGQYFYGICVAWDPEPGRIPRPFHGKRECLTFFSQRKAGAASADAQTIALVRWVGCLALGEFAWTDLELITLKSIYQNERHRKWRDKVLRKAGYLCEECARYGRRTEATIAHHIKHADEYPELRFDVSNGRALCAACHNKYHPEKGKSRNA